MRILATAALALVLAGPVQAQDDVPLDARPMTWRSVQLGPEQLYEGDFTIDYETSVFHADGAPAGETVWLSGWQDRPGDGGGIVRRYHLRFVGRHTLEPGKYGALGAYAHTILLTRLISARLLIGPEGVTPLKP
jgi:hypothetical protein